MFDHFMNSNITVIMLSMPFYNTKVWYSFSSYSSLCNSKFIAVKRLYNTRSQRGPSTAGSAQNRRSKSLLRPRLRPLALDIIHSFWQISRVNGNPEIWNCVYCSFCYLCSSKRIMYWNSHRLFWDFLHYSREFYCSERRLHTTYIHRL